jgi:enoyl-[acyl-carrier-protein] reductase (NADH)
LRNEYEEKYGGTSPNEKLSKTREVAEMADFLISEKAKSISGQVFWIMVSFHLNFKNKI